LRGVGGGGEGKTPGEGGGRSRTKDSEAPFAWGPYLNVEKGVNGRQRKKNIGENVGSGKILENVTNKGDREEAKGPRTTDPLPRTDPHNAR